jgi:hypothetical protein
MKKTLVFFSLQVSILASGQVSRTVVDSETKLPIPYATIKVLNKPRGVIASETGTFVLSIDPTDSILFSSVGYDSRTITAHDLLPTIFLKPLIRTMAAVNLPVGKIETIFFTGFDTNHFKDDWSWGPGGDAEFAQRMDIPDTTHSFRLMRIFVRIRKHGCYGPLMLHIYEADNFCDCPGTEIFSKAISLNRTNVKKQKGSIELLDNNLYFQGVKSFYVGFSWLPSELPCLSTIYFLNSTKKNTYSRSIYHVDYKWAPFTFKDKDGNPANANASIFITAQLGRYR